MKNRDRKPAESSRYGPGFPPDQDDDVSPEQMRTMLYGERWRDGYGPALVIAGLIACAFVAVVYIVT